ncbi:MAG TPA: tetratricopeptide repeat protein [Steroidobacteraceae bacterium]|jgi:tetratricopeptide (TPR) repeat protein|nr:tetratricopeptide repeat protein [Steroidobacteraceae bacterium]
MSKSFIAGVAAAVVIAIGSSAISLPAHAAEEKQSVSKASAKVLKAANEAVQAKKWPEALAKLQEAQGIAGKTPYDAYVTNQLLAFVYARQNNYPEAAKAMEAQIESGFVPPAEQAVLFKGLASVYYQQKNYAKSADYGQRLIKSGGGDGDTYTLVAQSYYLDKKYSETIKFLKDYISDVEKRGQTPKEQSLQLMSESYTKMNDNAGATAMLEKLVSYYPKPNYWDNLLFGLMRAEGNGDKLTLNIYRLMLETNTLKQPQDYTEMAQLAIEQGTPGEAQRVLEKGFAANVFSEQRAKDSNARLLESAKKAATADQASLAKFETEAKNAKTGEADVRLGQAYLSFDQYDKAAEAIQRGIAKGGLKSTEEAQILLGIAQIKLKKSDDAIKSFKAVKDGDPKYVRLANLWALHARA